MTLFLNRVAFFNSFSLTPSLSLSSCLITKFDFRGDFGFESLLEDFVKRGSLFLCLCFLCLCFSFLVSSSSLSLDESESEESPLELPLLDLASSTFSSTLSSTFFSVFSSNSDTSFSGSFAS